ncbi:MAG: DMT family transporter [Anaerolineaceae bacterium]|nr:DMT family transporter [Anaerolineaceae bacterium]
MGNAKGAMRWKSDLTLLFVAAIWGSGFVAQRLATTQLSTSYFNGGRFVLAALMLLIFALFQRGKPRVTRAELPWMILAGSLLFAAAWLQQAGLVTTTIGNASFITGLYVVLVPMILLVFWKKRVSWLSWMAVFLAALGVMLLSLQGEFRLARGDALELAGAVMWALHVILIGRLAGQGANVLWFSVIQFAICGLLNFMLAFGLDPQGAGSLLAAWPVIVYSGILPIGIGFSLQIAGQRHAQPVDAAIILSTEAVFGTLFGYLFLQELLSPRQLFGCALLLAAMILAQMRPGEAAQEPAVVVES